jgi:hypothetical protein
VRVLSHNERKMAEDRAQNPIVCCNMTGSRILTKLLRLRIYILSQIRMSILTSKSVAPSAVVSSEVSQSNLVDLLDWIQEPMATVGVPI